MKIHARWKANGQSGGDENRDAQVAQCPGDVSAGDIENWLIERIAPRLRLPQPQVGVTTPFLEYGMGSVDAVEIAAS